VVVVLLLVVGGALGIAHLLTPTSAPKQDVRAAQAAAPTRADAVRPPTLAVGVPAAPAVTTLEPRSPKGRDVEPRVNSPTPPTGVIERSRRKNAIATLAIETVAGNDHLVKLVNMSDPQDQVTIYVRGGENYSTKVPLGRYHIRAATGTTWYGKKDLFGPDTRFFRFIDKSPTPTERLKVFHFRVQGRQIMGVKVIFRESVFGDMVEESISRDDFVN
jgi:hypothetical protein